MQNYFIFLTFKTRFFVEIIQLFRKIKNFFQDIKKNARRVENLQAIYIFFNTILY